MVTSGLEVQSVDLLAAFFADTGQEIPVGSTIAAVRGRATLFPTGADTGARGDVCMAFMSKVPESSWSGIPDPESEIVDGMWYGQFIYGGRLESAAGVFAAGSVEQKMETAAKRKITATGDELRLVGVMNTGTDYTLQVAGNVLIMLP